MLMNLIGQLNAIARGSDAAYAGMRARDSQMGLIKGLNFNGNSGPNEDTFTPSKMANLAAQDKHLQIQEVQSNFVMDAMEAWRKSLAEKAKKENN